MIIPDNPPEEIMDNQIQTASHSLRTAYDEYINREKLKKHILVQRDERYFWDILFRQNFDLNHHEINVRFAGEAGSDDGGPLREFLTIAMRNFSQSGLLFGANNSLAFQVNPEAILQKRFYKIGQLVALSVLLNGRGPENIHPAVVRTLYNMEQPEKVEDIEDAFIKDDIESIKSGNYNCIYDFNILPSGKTTEELIRLYMIVALIQSKYSAIEQFRDGMNSVTANILHPDNYQLVRPLLEHRKIEYAFEDFISIIEYPQVVTCDTGSNNMGILRKCIAEFELLLLNVGQGNVELEEGKPLRYTDLLFFVSGCDRIPAYGFDKKIEVVYENVILAKASTCGLILTLPKDSLKIEFAIRQAIRFGDGFGVI